MYPLRANPGIRATSITSSKMRNTPMLWCGIARTVAMGVTDPRAHKTLSMSRTAIPLLLTERRSREYRIF
jgi:hypothetical protein